MIDINNLDAIEIGLAPPKKIALELQRLTKPQTINYAR